SCQFLAGSCRRRWYIVTLGTGHLGSLFWALGYPRIMKVRRILCAVDFSEPAHVALHYGADLARMFDADLTLFHVYHIPGYGMPEGSFILPGPETMSRLFATIDERLGGWRSEAESRGAMRVDVATAQGSAWHEIIERARSGYQLIVVGTHGHTGL